MFSVSLSMIFAFINLNSGIKTSEIQNKTLTEKIDCGIEIVTLKTERIEKKRKFLFWTSKHKKIIVTDRIIDENGNEVFQKKSVFVNSMDASDTRKFNRLKIVENEIWIFSHSKNADKVKPIKRYNFCGGYLGKIAWEDRDYYDD
jgi:hypothetical protein